MTSLNLFPIVFSIHPVTQRPIQITPASVPITATQPTASIKAELPTASLILTPDRII